MNANGATSYLMQMSSTFFHMVHFFKKRNWQPLFSLLMPNYPLIQLSGCHFSLFAVTDCVRSQVWSSFLMHLQSMVTKNQHRTLLDCLECYRVGVSEWS